MVDFLLKTVGPFFFGLGVSEADLKSYITTLQGYILAVLIALIVMLVILILAGSAELLPGAGVRCESGGLWPDAQQYLRIFKCKQGDDSGRNQEP